MSELAENPHAAVLRNIAGCTDTAKLLNFITNADKRGAVDVRSAAIRRVHALCLAAQPRSVAAKAELWTVISLYETLYSWIKRRPYALSKARERALEHGIEALLASWAVADKHKRIFDLLAAWDLPDLSAEAVIADHADKFPPKIVRLCRKRLEQIGLEHPAETILAAE